MRPTAGFCFIELDPKHETIEGGIIVPDRSQFRRGAAGRVVDASFRDADERESYGDIVGKRVIVRRYCGVEFKYDGKRLYRTRLKNCLATVEDGVKVNFVEDPAEPARCFWCPSEGEANILLDGEGYCPECGRNSAGELRPPPRVSEEEILQMATPQEVAVLRQMGILPRAKKKRVVFDMGRSSVPKILEGK